MTLAISKIDFVRHSSEMQGVAAASMWTGFAVFGATKWITVMTDVVDIEAFRNGSDKGFVNISVRPIETEVHTYPAVACFGGWPIDRMTTVRPARAVDSCEYERRQSLYRSSLPRLAASVTTEAASFAWWCYEGGFALATDVFGHPVSVRGHNISSPRIWGCGAISE